MDFAKLKHILIIQSDKFSPSILSVESIDLARCVNFKKYLKLEFNFKKLTKKEEQNLLIFS